MSNKLINVIINIDNTDSFRSQLPTESDLIDFHFNNLDESIIWDLVFFYGIPMRNYNFRIKNGASVFMSGEPKLMQSYSALFLNQFTYTITSYPLKKENHTIYSPLIPWFYGVDFDKNILNYNYSNLKSMQPLQKTKIMSVITSKKKFMPGHVKRLNFINELKNKFSDRIDFFGNESLRLADKAEGINNYKFHLCFENSSSNDYWTEKLSDPILGFSIPVYYGCKNIKSYFPKGIIQIDLNEIENSIQKVEYILNNHEIIYSKMISDSIHNRNLILNKFNLMNFIETFYFKKIHQNKFSILDCSFNSFDYYLSNKLTNLKLRGLRFISKHLKNIK